MKLLLAVLIILPAVIQPAISFPQVSVSVSPIVNVDVDTPRGDSSAVDTTAGSFIAALIQSEPVQQKINSIIDFIDLKIRAIQFLKSIFTTDNLILLRRALEFLIKLTSKLILILPESRNQANIFSLVNDIFPAVAGFLRTFQIGVVAGDTNESTDDLSNAFVSDTAPAIASISVSTQAPLLSTSRVSSGQPIISSTSAPSTSAPLVPITSAPLVLSTVGPYPPPQKQVTIGVNVGATNKREIKLSTEELKTLEDFGMNKEQAMNLANIIYGASSNEERIKILQTETNLVDKYGLDMEQVLNLANLVNGPKP